MERTIRVVSSIGNAFYALADDGTMAFVATNQVTPGELVWVDRTGAGTPLAFPPQRYLHPRLSPDGRWVAVTIREPRGVREAVWVLDLERGVRARFTDEGAVSRWPVWTHDGTRIAFVASRDGSAFDLYWKPVDGSDEARILLTGKTLKIPLSWAETHRTLVYYEIGPDLADIWTLPDEGAPSPLVASSADNRAPMFSPDGRWLAYVSNESGDDQVYVRPYPGPGAAMPISRDGGIGPNWSGDGRELYFRHEDQLMVVPIGADEMFGAPRTLFSGPYATSPIGRGNTNYDVAADGRFLMVRDLVGEDGVSPIYVVLNFTEELEAKVGR